MMTNKALHAFQSVTDDDAMSKSGGNFSRQKIFAIEKLYDILIFPSSTQAKSNCHSSFFLVSQ
jgi:hypothetical protein